MSEHITHVAVFEDAVRLMKLGENRFPGQFIQCMTDAYDTGLFCAAMRGGRYYIIPLIMEQRANRHVKLNSRQSERLAASLGAIAHRAADNTFKPMFEAAASDDNPHFYAQEAQTYHDAITFEKVYDNGKRPSVSPFQDFNHATLTLGLETIPGIENIAIEPLETLLTFGYLNDFAAVRQIDTSGLNAKDAANAIIKGVQSPYEPLPWYVQASRAPDPLKFMQYIIKPNMYNDGDLIIKLVREFQTRGKVASHRQLELALKHAESQSGYARALRLAWQYLNVAAALYQEHITEDEAYRALRIPDKQKRQIKAEFTA